MPGLFWTKVCTSVVSGLIADEPAGAISVIVEGSPVEVSVPPVATSDPVEGRALRSKLPSDLEVVRHKEPSACLISLPCASTL